MRVDGPAEPARRGASVGSPAAPWLAVVAALLMGLPAGCADRTTPALSQATVAAGPSLPDASRDGHTSDTGSPDDGVVDGVSDTSEVVGTGDTADTSPNDSLDTGDVAGLGPGEPCQADAQCAGGHCLQTRQGSRCAAPCEPGCESGFECGRVGADRVCVDRFASLCMPCDAHADCNLGVAAGLVGIDGGNRCVRLGEGRFCGVACGPEVGCPAGATCREGLCRPTDEVCECTGLAVERFAATTCGCGGERRCEVVGEAPPACDGPGPAAETCNGRDDDCDGVVDGTGLCGAYACRGEAGCLSRCQSNADCRPGLGCDRDDVDGDGVFDECLANGDNGTLCSADGDCASGDCSNGYCCPAGVGAASCCASDSDCAALDRPGTCSSTLVSGCTGIKSVGRCEGFVCVTRQAPAPEACAGRVCRTAACTGDAGGAPIFDGAHLCDDEGACVPTADRRCDDGDACTTDSCSAAGCATAPRTGVTTATCYSYDPATRGVGQCVSGVVSCADGQVNGCLGERGPIAEVCNGKDDDCDGTTDEDTERSCFPYLCGGAAGCKTSCAGQGDCAAGNFCDVGRCVGTGVNGAACQVDGQCASEHCSQGVCCASDLCCVSDSQCAALDERVCEVAEATGCFGFALRGVCFGDNRCQAIASIDLAGCAGDACKESRCEGASRVPQAVCTATGSCVASGPATSCAPFSCRNGECLTSCVTNADCSAGSCVGGNCVGLPDGAACTANAQCAVGRCNNGFCCGSGLCCGGDAACGALGEAGVCTNAAGCAGQKKVGVCGADHACRAEVRAAPEACAGAQCGEARCVNLAGLGIVLEGVERRTCSATGACEAVVRDCRDFPDVSYCVGQSDVYLACQGCSPRRATCVVFDNPCFCE